MRLKFHHGLDADMREQALQTFWQQYKNWLLGGFVGVFAIYGVTQAYIHYQSQALEEAALAFHQAMAEDTPDAYQSVATTGPAAFKALALFKLAEHFTHEKDYTQAAEIYGKINALGGISPLWRDLASLQHAELTLETDPAGAEAALQQLAAKKSPYRPHAYELLAVLAQNQADYNTAKAYYEYLLADATVTAQHQTHIKNRIAYLEGQGLISNGAHIEAK